MKYNCFMEFCYFLSNLNMNQPQVYMYPLPFEPPSHLSPYPIPLDVDSLISGSSAFSKSSLCIWKFSVHILLKPSLKDFEDYLASMWNERSCTVVWIFFGIAFLCDWNERWPFSFLWPLLSFPNLLAYNFNVIVK